MGRYFRASIWSWFPLWDRLVELCSDFLGDDLLRAMTYNDGAGPGDQETCNKIAERLESWIAVDSSDVFYRLFDNSGLRVTQDGKFVSDAELEKNSAIATRSPYSIDRTHIEEFVRFLRSCGGFSVC